MPSVVIKPARDRDEYVVWSTVTESPHGYGNRAQTMALLRSGIRGTDAADPDLVLRNADHWGSSARSPWEFGHWDDTEVIYKQAGLLPRRRLYKAAVFQCAGRERTLLDLLTPLWDDDGVRHLARAKRQTRNSLVSTGNRAEAEIAMAFGAVAAIKREVESW